MNNLFRFLALPAIVSALTASMVRGAPAGKQASDSTGVTTVVNVDLARYTGRWYEVAKIPNRFQKQCARGTTAEYTLREDGRITVVNQCIKDDGSLDEAVGIAKVVDISSNAKLKVSFVSFIGWRPFWGDYWVIGLDTDYRWAIVGTPNRKFGWVLSRTPTLDQSTMEEIFAVIERNGYSRSAFELSPQD